MIHGGELFDFDVLIDADLHGELIGLVVKGISGNGADDVAFLISFGSC